MSNRNSQRGARLVLLSIACAALMSCSGTTIVDYAVRADAASIALADTGQIRQPLTSRTRPTSPNALSPFQATEVEDDTIRWTLGTGTLGFGGRIENLSKAPICMRFEKARISSNFSPTPEPMLVYSMTIAKRGVLSQVGSTIPTKRTPLHAIPLCLSSNESADVSIGPMIDKLFPSSKLFNVVIDRSAGTVSETGVGNWLSIEVPVEIGPNSRMYALKLTAEASRARVSYY